MKEWKPQEKKVEVSGNLLRELTVEVSPNLLEELAIEESDNLLKEGCDDYL